MGVTAFPAVEDQLRTGASGVVQLNSLTHVAAGPGTWSAALRALPRTTAALIDTGLPGAAALASALEGEGLRARRLPAEASLAVVEDAAAWVQALPAGTTHLLAVGGGSVLDVAKLANALCGSRLTLPGAARRHGIVRLPASPQPRLQLWAAPTTVGTSAEVSAVACVEVVAGRRSLVMSPRLAPASAFLDPSLVADLPIALVREGALEALLRVLGPEVATASTVGVAGEEAAFLVAGLARRLGRLAAVPGSRCEDGGRVAHEIACLGLATQRGWAMTGRGLTPHPLWYVANELSGVAGVRKMHATAALLPGWLSRVRDGDGRWGDRDRLARIWTALTSAAGLPSVAAPEEVLDVWQIERRIDLAEPEASARQVALRCVERWGGSLPMLGRFSEEDLIALVLDGLRAPAGPTPGGRSPGEEQRLCLSTY